MFLEKYRNYQFKKSEESLPEKDGFSEQKFQEICPKGIYYLEINISTKFAFYAFANSETKPALNMKARISESSSSLKFLVKASWFCLH